MSHGFLFSLPRNSSTQDGSKSEGSTHFQHVRRLPRNHVQDGAPVKDKVQPHLLQEAITDMITEVEELGQV